MNTDLPSTDPIISQFRISPDLMPKMSTPTMAPNYTSIRKFQLALEENALSIQSHQTELGHLALVITEADYLQANSDIAFDEPTDPGLVPPDPTEGISTRASAEHDVAMLPYTTAATMRTFNFAQQEFFRFKATKAALRNLILNSIDDKYIKTLKNEHTRYAKVSPLALMTHIWTTYGAVDDADQTQNEMRMKQQWNPPTPIETLFEQLEDGKHFAAKGHEVIDDTQLIRWAYDNIKRTGLFDRDCEKWRKKPHADKDWTSFQQFFLEADEDRKKNSTTASEATYTANQVQELLQHEIDTILQTTEPPPATTPPISNCLSQRERYCRRCAPHYQRGPCQHQVQQYQPYHQSSRNSGHKPTSPTNYVPSHCRWGSGQLLLDPRHYAQPPAHQLHL